MTRHLGTGRAVALTLISALIVVLAPAAPPALAATPITVTQAIGQQHGTSQTVRGYVVGHPTATNTVVKSGFPNDYALAIADSASQASTSQMLYVQIPSAFRSQWGLRTNPSLMGKQIDVTGTLAAIRHRVAPARGTAPTTRPRSARRVRRYAPRCTASSTVVARMLFYMAIRYEGDDGYPNLELNNSINGSTPWHGKTSVLLQWNSEDPVSTFEMRRNDRIHSTWQGNRNPFIDHPEWATAIWN